MRQKKKAILFDLDGTLLPMDLNVFLKSYLPLISVYAAEIGAPAEVGRWIMAGTEVMTRMTGGEKTCREGFWEAFARLSGRDDIPAMEKKFGEFYEGPFGKLSALCPPEPRSERIVRTASQRGLRCALATMPVFPRAATHWRLRWAGLTPEDFEIVTTYEICHAAKPSVAYYREILDWMGLKPADCVMVGNDVGDDMNPALELGMDAFYLDVYPENRTGGPENYTWRGGYDALLELVESL